MLTSWTASSRAHRKNVFFILVSSNTEESIQEIIIVEPLSNNNQNMIQFSVLRRYHVLHFFPSFLVTFFTRKHPSIDAGALA